MDIRATNTLHNTLQNLALVSNGEDLYWLGHRMAGGVMEIVISNQVPGQRRVLTTGQFEFIPNNVQDIQIADSIVQQGYQLSSLHNHPAMRPDGTMIDTNVLSYRDNIRFNTFHQSHHCEFNFILIQYPNSTQLPTQAIQFRQFGAVLQFFLGNYKCELMLFHKPHNKWVATDLTLV